MHSRLDWWSGFCTRCSRLYSDAVDFLSCSWILTALHVSVGLRSCASSGNVEIPGSVRLSFHLTESTVMDRGGTLAGSFLTMGENMSMNSLNKSRILRARALTRRDTYYGVLFGRCAETRTMSFCLVVRSLPDRRIAVGLRCRSADPEMLVVQSRLGDSENLRLDCVLRAM
jgi:hypothetical protein